MTQLYYKTVGKGGKVSYHECLPDQIPDAHLNTDKHKAMTLQISVAAMESVMLSEKPKSARYTRVSRAIDQVLALVDEYRINAWPAEDISKAADLVDHFNAQIAGVFGEKST